MPSFFTLPPPKKKNAIVFAGLDEPFNFPSSKMRYNARSHSRTRSPDSATDSGYGSSVSTENLNSPPSPKSQMLIKHKRRLQKRDGLWGLQNYEYQCVANDITAETEPVLYINDNSSSSSSSATHYRAADNAHEWKPNPQRTFTHICRVAPPKPKWYASRLYGRALQRREKSEGLTELQRSLAPVLRRPSMGDRMGSTLLHPSPPLLSGNLAASMSLTTSISAGMDTGSAVALTSACTLVNTTQLGRGRGRNPSTLLHPSSPTTTTPPYTPSSPSTPTLRSPRHRSPTPLRIPTTSAHQPTPTPLRIRLRKPSVLHSCFSDDEASEDDHDRDDEASEHEHESESASESASLSDVDDGVVGKKEKDEDEDEDEVDRWYNNTNAAGFQETAFQNKHPGRNGAMLARSGLVARAHRVQVVNPGLVGNERRVELWF